METRSRRPRVVLVRMALSRRVRAAVFVRAHELVEHGWTQSAYARAGSGWAVPIARGANGTVRVCGVGALEIACDELDIPPQDRDSLYMELVELLPTAYPRELFVLERWNDEHTRHKADVLALYDNAIHAYAARPGDATNAPGPDTRREP